MSEYESTEFSNTEATRPEREGLPRSYRMRADAHYVDSLSSSPRAERARDHARGTTVTDTFSQPAFDRRVLDQLSEDVAAIESAAGMITGDQSALARRVGLDLIKAQASRAAWLLRATALLSGSDIETPSRGRTLAAVAAQVRDRAGVECRLVGVGFDVDCGDAANLAIAADSTLVTGLTGAVMAQLGLLAGVDGATIRLVATTAEGEVAAIDVVQDVAPVQAANHARFFDAGWNTRPGGWLAGIGAAAARAAAERMGGRVALVPGERRGCTIRWTFGGEAADQSKARQ